MTGSSGDSGFTAPFTHRPARLRMFWITASLGACWVYLFNGVSAVFHQ